MEARGRGFFCLALGIALGVGAYVLIKNGMARKAAVAVATKGLDLKERVTEMAERVKESAEDVMAEARFVGNQDGSDA